jgi:hypothetical protein
VSSSLFCAANSSLLFFRFELATICERFDAAFRVRVELTDETAFFLSAELAGREVFFERADS